MEKVAARLESEEQSICDPEFKVLVPQHVPSRSYEGEETLGRRVQPHA